MLAFPHAVQIYVAIEHVDMQGRFSWPEPSAERRMLALAPEASLRSTRLVKVGVFLQLGQGPDGSSQETISKGFDRALPRYQIRPSHPPPLAYVPLLHHDIYGGSFELLRIKPNSAAVSARLSP